MIFWLFETNFDFCGIKRNISQTERLGQVLGYVPPEGSNLAQSSTLVQARQRIFEIP